MILPICRQFRAARAGNSARRHLSQHSPDKRRCAVCADARHLHINIVLFAKQRKAQRDPGFAVLSIESTAALALSHSHNLILDLHSRRTIVPKTVLIDFSPALCDPICPASPRLPTHPLPPPHHPPPPKRRLLPGLPSILHSQRERERQRQTETETERTRTQQLYFRLWGL